jgi:GTP 3',8-cyclase
MDGRRLPLGDTSAPPGGPSSARARLDDGHGRTITDLRISVTDRCNLRCVYCLPARGARFLAPGHLLSFEEIARLAEAAAGLGVRKLRLTGGEPLVRPDLHRLVARLCAIPGVADVPLTTNGVLLAQQAADLYAAGARRLNVSLDALDGQSFRRMTRSPTLGAVLAGIATARRVGFQDIKLNMIPIRGRNEDQILPLARLGRRRGAAPALHRVHALREQPLVARAAGERRGCARSARGGAHPRSRQTRVPELPGGGS